MINKDYASSCLPAGGLANFLCAKIFKQMKPP